MTALKKTPTPDVHEKVKLPVGVTIDGKCYKDIELHPVTIGASYESQIDQLSVPSLSCSKACKTVSCQSLWRMVKAMPH